jgi:hypothetical protein
MSSAYTDPSSPVLPARPAPPPCPVPQFAPVRAGGGRFRLRRALRRWHRALAAGLATVAAASAVLAVTGAPGFPMRSA